MCRNLFGGRGRYRGLIGCSGVFRGGGSLGRDLFVVLPGGLGVVVSYMQENRPKFSPRIDLMTATRYYSYK